MKYIESIAKVVGSVLAFLVLSIIASLISTDMLWKTVVRAVLECMTFAFFFRFVSKKQTFHVDFTPFLFAMIFLVAVGITILGDAVSQVYAYFSPKMVEDVASTFIYTKSEGWQAIMALVALGILTPIGEELFLRGVVLQCFRESFSVWVAVVLQALLFGILHMNLVQGTFAFLVGLLMGMIYVFTNNLKFTIMIHIINNISSFAAMRTGEGFATLPFVEKWLMTICGCIILLGGIYLFMRGTLKQMRLIAQKKEEM